MKAQELNGTHLGKRLTVNIGHASITDVLSGVSVTADLIQDGPIFGTNSNRPQYVLGRTHVTLAFLTTGTTQSDPDTEVTIHGEQEAAQPKGQHWLTEDHNTDPVCACGWRPESMWPRERAVDRADGREMVRRHIRSNQPLASNTGHPDDDRGSNV
jgi:hypothetical protein